MGLLDKIKDLFTDEEEVVEEEKDNKVRIKEIKKDEIRKKFEEGIEEETSEHKLPTFMRNKLLEEEETNQKVENNEDVGSRVNSSIINNLYTDDTVEIPKSTETSSFKFPVDFDESDFLSREDKKDYKEEIKEVDEPEEEPVPSIIRQENKKRKVADLYKDKITTEDEHKFKASPIISPIYGVLNKNYSKEEIKEIDEDSYEIKRNSVSKNVDFESVRKKAYGSLVDDIKDNINCENCEYRKEVQQKEAESDKNLVYDILKEDEEEKNKDLVDDISFGDATENYYDYGVEYEPPKRKNKEKTKEKKEEIKIVNSETVEEENTKEKNKKVPPVKSNINLLSTLKKSIGEEENSKQKNDLELTDDLFNMIDSMYDERNDD